MSIQRQIVDLFLEGYSQTAPENAVVSCGRSANSGFVRIDCTIVDECEEEFAAHGSTRAMHINKFLLKDSPETIIKFGIESGIETARVKEKMHLF
jgi:hypothetical protein